jgi:hypothetical protein
MRASVVVVPSQYGDTEPSPTPGARLRPTLVELPGIEAAYNAPNLHKPLPSQNGNSWTFTVVDERSVDLRQHRIEWCSARDFQWDLGRTVARHAASSDAGCSDRDSSVGARGNPLTTSIRTGVDFRVPERNRYR